MGLPGRSGQAFADAPSTASFKDLGSPPAIWLFVSVLLGVCLCGLRAVFWIHDEQPDPDEWDGEVETASNVIPLTNSFTDYIAGIGPREDSDRE